MTTATALPLRFQIGARTLLTLPRRLVRVPFSLEMARAKHLPALPALPTEADGHFITSLPEDRVSALRSLAQGRIVHVRQRYMRHFIDLEAGFDAWFAGLSGNARSQARRKAKKLATASGGTLDIRRFRTPAELERFHTAAREISRRTYQERLLDAGLPGDTAFRDGMARMAAAGRVRAWLLYVGDTPAAYLYCPVEGRTVIYEYVGHDPAFNALSPGAVLQVEALRDLFAEGRFSAFDFTEGEGQHKRQMASGGIACVDLLLLRPTLGNRAAVAALRVFDGAVAGGKRTVHASGMRRFAAKLRRG
ncbi:GNAT family N-acetyltransferase [Stakelama saccharophila]|uniref:GNAT family N-acetyltransferase n=1 Tax=Stakelama saccharophila TaxID=3075605 RepID=A0ABZ0BBK4_9SPHN|nr:GNAT family N-acetyltransferase [Stakelama sp. W311]WNO54664.1 GNAT family N-acetyltransferase [Stakelama sp. W311]